MTVRAFGLACAVGSVHAVTTSERANPIRRVVTMLQQMQKKVTAEGQRDEDLFNKFMCYCKTGAGDLKKSIDAAEAKMPTVMAALEEAKSKETQLKSDLKKHKSDRSDAKDALAKAKAIRAKEASTFAKDSADLETNIKAMTGAIAAITKGSAGFLQTEGASVVRRLVIDMDLSSSDRSAVSAFLSQGESNEGEYVPASGEINGILKQMKDTMVADLATLVDNEKKAISAFEGVVAAKEKEIAVNSKSIEEKTERVGKVGVDIVNLKNDIGDTADALEEDKKFLKDLSSDCATKQSEYDVVVKTRAEELVALSDTIKILNDDDALDLFKQTLPSASLLQIKVTDSAARRKALDALHQASSGHSDHRLDLISLALRGRKVNFDKVLTMIDEMSAILKKEQVADDEKKATCEANLDKAEDEQKELNLDISDLTKSIEEAKGAIESLSGEMDALSAGIISLDKSVAAATEQRKAESAEYQSTMASDTAAKELLNIAKNRLNKFYNPSLHKAAPKQELSAEQRIAVNMGSEAAPTVAPSGIAGTGVTALVQVRSHSLAAPPPAPEAVGAYKKKGEESAGVMAMVDLLVADLDKEMTEMKTNEKDSQADYEKFIADSGDKRRLDKQNLEDKTSAKAEAEALLQKHSMEKKDKVADAYANSMVLRDLHLDCDWLISNYAVRKEARTGEVDSLTKAKAVLSGADFSLAQVSTRHLRG